jgi:hypothetical protein
MEPYILAYITVQFQKECSPIGLMLIWNMTYICVMTCYIVHLVSCFKLYVMNKILFQYFFTYPMSLIKFTTKYNNTNTLKIFSIGSVWVIDNNNHIKSRNAPFWSFWDFHSKLIVTSYMITIQFCLHHWSLRERGNLWTRN